MATYTYKALDSRGASASGQVDGDTKAAVAASLRNKGLTVVDINEVKTSLAKVDIFAGLQRIKAKDLTVFSRQFATMINSGLAMLRALTVLEDQTENKKFATVLGAVRADVEAGISLSDALEKHPKVFSPLYINMIRAGEIGGILDDVLNRLATQLEKDDSIKRAVKSAMTYPIMIGSFAVVVLVGMVMFLIPVFAGIYKSLGNAKLPELTRIMVFLSNQLKSWHGVIIAVAIVGLVVGLRKLKRTDKGREVWDRFKLHIPMGIGEVVRKIVVARFSRTLATLVSAGVPILQAIDITGKSAGNVVIEHAMDAVEISVKEGQTISEPLKGVGVFPDMVVQMISVGEETGSLDSMLQKVADFYDDEVSAAVKSLTSIIEPIMMLGVGAMVGVVVISMYLPIFDMMNIVKQ
jgi:type IV pilus assembly protein PilC